MSIHLIKTLDELVLVAKDIKSLLVMVALELKKIHHDTQALRRLLEQEQSEQHRQIRKV